MFMRKSNFKKEQMAKAGQGKQKFNDGEGGGEGKIINFGKILRVASLRIIRYKATSCSFCQYLIDIFSFANQEC